MSRIASPNQLIREIQTLRSEASTGNPSRVLVAARLRELADSLVAEPPRSASSEEEKESPRVQVILRVGEEPRLLDASKLIKPSGLAGLSQPAVHYFQHKKVWMIVTDVDSKSAAERIGRTVQKNLVPKTKLMAADPYLHHIPLYVTYKDGFAKLDGEEEKPKDTTKSDAKHKLLLKGKDTFGEKGVKLTGGEGEYTLEILPVRKEFRGKFRASKVTAPTLEALSAKLDEAIDKVSQFLDSADRTAAVHIDPSILGITSDELEELDEDERLEELANLLDQAADLLMQTAKAFSKELGSSKGDVTSAAKAVVQVSRKVR